MTNEKALEIRKCVEEVAEDYFDAMKEPKTPVNRRYLHKKAGEINGLCKAYEILTGVRLRVCEDGIREEVE